jgi:hypothetical protein
MADKFQETLKRIENELTEMYEQCQYIRHFYDTGNKEQAYATAFELAKISEKVTLLSRALPCYTGNPKAKDDMERCIQESVPVEIGFTKEGWFSIRIPKLLPKKGAGSVDYIRGILWPALSRFFLGKPLVRYSDCVLIYRHVYGSYYKKRYMRDHDNVETYMISDMVAMYVLYDDCPYLCNNYDCTAEGDGERTEVYVVPKAEFLEWLEEEKRMPREGVKLYETKLSRA